MLLILRLQAKCHPIITLQNGKMQVKITDEPLFDHPRDLMKIYAPERQRRIKLKGCMPPRQPCEYCTEPVYTDHLCLEKLSKAR